MRWWEGNICRLDEDKGGEGAAQVFLPWIVGAVLRVDVEFFTLQNTRTKVFMH